MSTSDHEQYEDYEEALSAYSEIIALVLVLPLTIVHATKLYSDFFTEERKVLSYRRQKPKITPGYKRMAYANFACVILYLLTIIAANVSYNFAKGDCAMYLAASVFDKLFFLSAKTTLYIILIYRLNEVYGESAYGYNVGTLKCIGILIIILNILSFVFTVTFSAMEPTYYDDTDDVFPYFCQILPDEPYINIVGGFQGLVDITCCVCSMIAFIVPLNKVVKACDEYKKSNKKDAARTKRLNKMMYTGYKYKILVVVAAVSTLTWLVLVVAGLVAIGTCLAHMDHAINPICLLLMTQYYPSDKYYERMCCPCICCCDPKRESYHSKASQAHQEITQEESPDSTVVKSSMGPSVDTDMAVVDMAVVKTGAADDYANSAETNLAVAQEQNKEITPDPTDEQNHPDDANL